ncbi:hypothetical protein [Halocynthiibacter styelae]|uniref:Uncharacterized protein n=1 Tax=Halocynthiibacter styelae TaxID=2761955 RepID=A0A8J7LP53_9RHOB|nr:hypothetical protein [Paenihalocynthiibacter styelae]MBI1492347.1 hypothetical protein [Paenihalocynthiibacter styelae]
MSDYKSLRNFVYVVSVVGAIGFTLAFLAVLTGRNTIDAGLQRFAVYEVENRLVSLAGAPPSDEIRRDLTMRQRLALRLAGEAEEHAGLLTKISENAEQLVSVALADRCGKSCLEAPAGLSVNTAERLLTIKGPGGRSVYDFINMRYDRALNGFLLDAKIFTGTNALLFIMVLLTAKFQPSRASLLLRLEMALVGTVAAGCWFFLRGKDWGMVLLTNDFTGWAYAGFAGFVFLWLCDLLFLKGYITAKVLELIGNMIGSALSNFSPG